MLTRHDCDCRNLPSHRFFLVVRQVGARKIDRLFAVIMEFKPVAVVAVFVLQTRVIDGGELVYNDRWVGMRRETKHHREQQGMRHHCFKPDHGGEVVQRVAASFSRMAFSSSLLAFLSPSESKRFQRDCCSSGFPSSRPLILRRM